MQLHPLAAVAVQLPLLVAATVALLRGDRGVRWLRVVLLGLAWVIVEALLHPIAVGDEGLLADVPVVPAVTVAGLLVALLAAAVEVRTARSVVGWAAPGILTLAGVFLAVPGTVALALAVALWVVGTLNLGRHFLHSARRHPASLLEARLRLLAGSQWLLASAALSVFGGPFLVVWVLPMVVGTLILVIAVAPPPFLRLAPSGTRAAMRSTDTHLAAIGPADTAALHAAVEDVRAVFGAEATVLLDEGAVVSAVGEHDAVELARRWVRAWDGATAPRHELARLDDGRRVLAGSTSRGSLVLVLPPIGVLLSRTDREHVDALAERLGLVMAREAARRADERAAASAEAAERMRDDMLSTLSHELRTPLTTIMGFAEVLRTRAAALSEEQVHDMLERIVAKGMHLEGIVAALLELTAVRGRSQPDRIAVYELRDLVERAVLRADLGPRRVHVEGDAGVVHTDGGAVLAVLGELLANAAKFTPATATVRVQVGSAPEHQVWVEVADDGPGLCGLEETVLEPFVRGGELLTRDTGGVGVGLTIARELAHQLGGRLVVLRPTDGAAFRLALPRRHHLAPRGDASRPLPAVQAEGDSTLVPSGRRGGLMRPMPPRAGGKRAAVAGSEAAVRGSG